MPTAVRALQNEPIDALVWRVTGRGPGAVEAVLEANRDLPSPDRLAEGRLVIVPDSAHAPAAAPMIQLWD